MSGLACRLTSSGGVCVRVLMPYDAARASIRVKAKSEDQNLTGLRWDHIGHTRASEPEQTTGPLCWVASRIRSRSS